MNYMQLWQMIVKKQRYAKMTNEVIIKLPNGTEYKVGRFVVLNGVGTIEAVNK